MSLLLSITFLGLGAAHLTQPGADDAVPGGICIIIGLCLLAA